MKAYVYKPTNEYVGTFSVAHPDEVRWKLGEFLKSRKPVPVGSYVECGWTEWKISQVEPLYVSEEHFFKHSNSTAPTVIRIPPKAAMVLSIVGLLAWVAFLIKLLGSFRYEFSWVFLASKGAETAAPPVPAPLWLVMFVFVMSSTAFVCLLTRTLRSCLEPSAFDTHSGYSWKFAGSQSQYRPALNYEVWDKYGNKPTHNEMIAVLVGMASVFLLAGLTRVLVGYWLGVVLWAVALVLMLFALSELSDRVNRFMERVEFGDNPPDKLHRLWLSRKWEARISQAKAISIVAVVVGVAFSGISLFST